MDDATPPGWAIPLLQDVAAMRGAFTGLDTRVAGLDTRVAALNSAFTGLRTDLMDRMDRLQDSITAMRDDIAVNMAAVERADRNTHSVREEGRGTHEILQGVIRQVRRLQAQVDELRDRA